VAYNYNPHIVTALSGGLGGRSTEDGVCNIGKLFEKAVGAAEILSERTGSNGLRRRDSPAPIDSRRSLHQQNDLRPPSPLQTQVVAASARNSGYLKPLWDGLKTFELAKSTKVQKD
jgi:hypothetical protein